MSTPSIFRLRLRAIPGSGAGSAARRRLRLLSVKTSAGIVTGHKPEQFVLRKHAICDTLLSRLVSCCSQQVNVLSDRDFACCHLFRRTACPLQPEPRFKNGRQYKVVIRLNIRKSVRDGVDKASLD